MSGNALQQEIFVIAPRALCQSCTSDTGPRFSLAPFQLPSESVAHRNNPYVTVLERESRISEVHRAESEAIQVDQEISRLETALQVLKTRRNELKLYVVNQKSLLAPIRKLPVDVLRYMFLVCLDDLEGARFLLRSRENRRVQLTVVQVIEQICALWRFVAHSTTRLWSRVNVSYFLTKNSKKEMLGCLLEKYIRLSREVPMTIRFGYLVTFSTLGNIVEPLLLQERFLQLLAGSAHHFEDIRDIEWEMMSAVMALMPMDAPFSRLKSLFISRISSSFLLNPTPNLTHLSVDGVHNSDARISFQSIPFLTHFEICGLKYPQVIFQAFPWAQITHFTSKPYVRYRERELSSILQQMKNLLSLNLMGETVIGRSIILTTLHTLSLERSRDRTDALNVICAPNLKILRLNQSAYEKSIVLQFLNRSGCSLEELETEICSEEDPEHDISSPFQEGWKSPQLQSLKRLRLAPSVKSIMLDLFWLNTQNEYIDDNPTLSLYGGLNVLPHLEILELQSVPKPDSLGVVEELIQMIMSRLPPLQHELEVDDESSEEAETYLKHVTVSFYQDLYWNEEVMVREFLRSDVVNQSRAHITITWGD